MDENEIKLLEEQEKEAKNQPPHEGKLNWPRRKEEEEFEARFATINRQPPTYYPCLDKESVVIIDGRSCYRILEEPNLRTRLQPHLEALDDVVSTVSAANIIMGLGILTYSLIRSFI